MADGTVHLGDIEGAEAGDVIVAGNGAEKAVAATDDVMESGTGRDHGQRRGVFVEERRGET